MRRTAGEPGQAAVRVLLHNSHVCGPTTALLLEHCRLALESVLPEPEQDTIIAHLLHRL
ncbi:MAG: hypothetical protein ACRDSR_07610 [Pseudonocardiaceae bacterium]